MLCVAPPESGIAANLPYKKPRFKIISIILPAVNLRFEVACNTKETIAKSFYDSMMHQPTSTYLIDNDFASRNNTKGGIRLGDV